MTSYSTTHQNQSLVILHVITPNAPKRAAKGRKAAPRTVLKSLRVCPRPTLALLRGANFHPVRLRVASSWYSLSLSTPPTPGENRVRTCRRAQTVVRFRAGTPHTPHHNASYHAARRRTRAHSARISVSGAGGPRAGGRHPSSRPGERRRAHVERAAATTIAAATTSRSFLVFLKRFRRASRRESRASWHSHPALPPGSLWVRSRVMGEGLPSPAP